MASPLTPLRWLAANICPIGVRINMDQPPFDLLRPDTKPGNARSTSGPMCPNSHIMLTVDGRAASAFTMDYFAGSGNVRPGRPPFGSAPRVGRSILISIVLRSTFGPWSSQYVTDSGQNTTIATTTS
jgi:hypothetical protein